MAKISQLFVEALKEAGVRHVFGIPSIHNIGLYNALRDESSIRHILCRHEASATHMADGYARSGKGVGVVITSTGPGAGYMVAPLIEALGNLSPVLAITTNIAEARIGRGTGVLHEVEEQDRIFRTITKERFCLRHGQDVKGEVRNAVQAALAGCPGPVYCEVPADLWDREGESGKAHDSVQGSETVDGEVDRAVQMLCEAERPVIIAGTGALRAGIGDEIKIIAETLRAPVFTGTGGKGLIPEDHEMAFGNASRRGAAHEALKSCTVTLAIGTRLRSLDYQRHPLDLPRLIHIDWDNKMMGRNFPTELLITGDIRIIARRLAERISCHPQAAGRSDWFSDLRARTREERMAIAGESAAVAYLDAIRRVIPRSGSLVIDNTMLGYYAELFYPALGPGELICAKGSAIIGFSFPAAIGLKIACPERPLVAVIGDGGFLYGAHELATCRRHNIGFPVVVVNDNSYGMIAVLERQIYGRDHFETDLLNPDIATFAASFGVGSVQTDSPEGLEQALREAMKSGEMRVIELKAAFDINPFVKY